MRLLLVAICLYMIIAHRAHAQNSITTTKTTVSETSAVKEKKFSLFTDLSVDSNMKNSSQSDYASHFYARFIPALRISSKAQVKADIVIEQKNHADRSAEIIDIPLIVERDPIDFFYDSKLKLSLFGMIPANESNRNDNSFQGGAGFATGIQKNFSVLKRELVSSYTFSFLQNFYEFERNNTNGANLNYRLRHTVVLNQELDKEFSAEILLRYQTGWTYTNALRSIFVISESLAYKVNKNASVYIQHTNDGDALEANGVDSNVKLYDEKSSVWGAGLSIVY